MPALRRWCGAAALVAAFMVLAAGPSLAQDDTDPNQQATATTVNPLSAREEAIHARYEKLLQGVEQAYSQTRLKAGELSLQVLKAQAKANELVEKPGDVEKRFRENKLGEGMSEFKQIYEACIVQLKKQDAEYARLQNQIVGLVGQRSFPEALKPRAEELAKGILSQREALIKRQADLYTNIADYKPALQIYMALYQAIPEEERNNKEHEALRKQIMDLRKKLGLDKDEKKDNNNNNNKNDKKEEEKKQQQQRGGWKQ